MDPARRTNGQVRSFPALRSLAHGAGIPSDDSLSSAKDIQRDLPPDNGAGPVVLQNIRVRKTALRRGADGVLKTAVQKLPLMGVAADQDPASHLPQMPEQEAVGIQFGLAAQARNTAGCSRPERASRH